MEISNIEVLNAYNALQTLTTQEMKGGLSFKIFKLASQMENEVVKPLRDAVKPYVDEEGHITNQEEYNEVLNEVQDVEFSNIDEDMLTDIDISVEAISLLKNFINFK